MTRIEAASVVVILVVAVGAASLWFGRREPVPPPPSPAFLPDSELVEEAPTPTIEIGSGDADALLGRPVTVDYPFDDQYQGQGWSTVPYELVAASDGSDEEGVEGPRRLFIAVVEPGLPDESIERLVRDLRVRHRSAEVLRIRIFDDRDAALTPTYTDDGAAREAHLQADLLREPGRERFVLRGREVRP